jgi:hypothetical protein
MEAEHEVVNGEEELFYVGGQRRPYYKMTLEQVSKGSVGLM